MKDQDSAALVIHRLGFAPSADTLAAIATDPRAALLAELSNPKAGLIDQAGLMSSAEAFRENRGLRKELKEFRKKNQNSGEKGEKANPVDASGRPIQPARFVRDVFNSEIEARLAAALDAKIGFSERWVWFWSNHFCVAAGAGTRPLVGAFEREAIRAHAFGRFADMLLAVEMHPAMLIYLNNNASIGPNSAAGRRRNRGLNENLAREIMELHTLGVRTGYTQTDVTSFAKIITGWRVAQPQQSDGGEFRFFPRAHEPGAQVVLGKTYPDGGVEQGQAVLRDLAKHPATAKHIATKLARHFVADDPPRRLVNALETRFRETDGDLKELAKTLIIAPDTWEAPRAKLKRPGEWLVGALRVLGGNRPRPGFVVQNQTTLGEPWWRPPGPNGFSDDSTDWMSGLPQRIDVANFMASRDAGTENVETILDRTVGSLASAETRKAIQRAESRSQALSLLLMAPEFQRR